MIGNIALIIRDKPWSRGASSFLPPPGPRLHFFSSRMGLHSAFSQLSSIVPSFSCELTLSRWSATRREKKAHKVEHFFGGFQNPPGIPSNPGPNAKRSSRGDNLTAQAPPPIATYTQPKTMVGKFGAGQPLLSKTIEPSARAPKKFGYMCKDRDTPVGGIIAYSRHSLCCDSTLISLSSMPPPLPASPPEEGCNPR